MTLSRTAFRFASGCLKCCILSSQRIPKKLFWFFFWFWRQSYLMHGCSGFQNVWLHDNSHLVILCNNGSIIQVLNHKPWVQWNFDMMNQVEDAHWEIWIIPLKETNLVMSWALYDGFRGGAWGPPSYFEWKNKKSLKEEKSAGQAKQNCPALFLWPKVGICHCFWNGSTDRLLFWPA